jgi:molybdopterin-guanine dinucleotide biosynthesis protein A
VILAGGPGQRIGGNKLIVALRGRPLVRYPLDAMRAAVGDVALIAKADTVLPPLSATMVWIEPDEPADPLAGIAEALALSGGRPVLVCPCDLPFVTPELFARLAVAAPEGARAVVAARAGVAYPLLGCYQPSAIQALSDAAEHGTPPLEMLASLNPALVEVADVLELFDVDTPDDLLQASGILDQRRLISRT